MLGSFFCNSDKPSRDILHAVECAPSETAQKLYYCRSGDIPDGADARLYDLGIFQLATLNMGADYTGMGQLWVSYDVTFSKAVMNNQLDSPSTRTSLTLLAWTTAMWFGTSQTAATGNNLGITFDSSMKFSFPPTIESGYYMVAIFYQGSGAAVCAFNTSQTNCTAINGGTDTVSDANGVSNKIMMTR